MAGCRIVDTSVSAAVAEIKTSSESYKSAGEDFISALKSAIAEMEGETKDALLNFITSDVNEFVVVSLPTAVMGMSDLLEANRTNFIEVDAQIAASISG